MPPPQKSELNPSDWVRTPSASAYVKYSPSTLAKLRCSGGGPRYSKLGPRIVVYRVKDLDDWLAARSRQSTSDLNAEGQ